MDESVRWEDTDILEVFNPSRHEAWRKRFLTLNKGRDIQARKVRITPRVRYMEGRSASVRIGLERGRNPVPDRKRGVLG
jgi:hypothetical protein